MTRRSVLIAGLIGTVLLLAAAFAATGAWGDAVIALQRWQTELNRSLSVHMRTVRDDGLWAAGGLIAISFLYGVVHAAGPGHGKAVIAAYVLADARRFRHGLVLAWASALMQAVTAIVLIGAVVMVAGAAARDAQPIALLLERLGFVLIIAIGAAMIWSAARRPAPNHHDHDHRHDHGACGHGRCSHVHAPAPTALDGASWKRAAAIVVSVGIRPCSGALLVLGFAHVVGIFHAGIIATFAMAVGTALTVSLLATLAVGSRNLAMTAVDARWVRAVETGIVLAGGLALIMLGTMLLSGSFQTVQGPFR